MQRVSRFTAQLLWLVLILLIAPLANPAFGATPAPKKAVVAATPMPTKSPADAAIGKKCLTCHSADVSPGIYGDGISYPPCINEAAPTQFVREAAALIGQDLRRIELANPYMFSEDFSFMLQAVPGAFSALAMVKARACMIPVMILMMSFW